MPPARSRRSRRWLAPLGAAIGLGLLAYVVSRQPIHDIGAAARSLGAAVLLLPPLALTWFAANTHGLYVMLEARVPWRLLFMNRLMGDGYNSLVPVTGLAGEPFKIVHLARALPAETATVAIIADKLANMASGFVISVVCLVPALLALDWPPALRTVIWGWIALATPATFAISWLAVSHAPSRLSGRALGWLGQAADGRTRVGTRRYLQALGWQLVGRAFGLVELALLLVLLDLPVTAPALGAIGGLLMLAGVFGFVIPQGFGAYEAAAIYAFTLLDYPAEAGLVFGLARRGRMLVLGVVGVLAHVASRRRIGPDRRIEPDQTKADESGPV